MYITASLSWLPGFSIGAAVKGEAHSVSDQRQPSTEQQGNAARPLGRGTNFTAGKAKESSAEAALCYFILMMRGSPELVLVRQSLHCCVPARLS